MEILLEEAIENGKRKFGGYQSYSFDYTISIARSFPTHLVCKSFAPRMSVSLAKFVAKKFDLDVNDVIETFAEYKQKSARGPKKDDWDFLQEMHDSVLASHKLSHPDPIDTKCIVCGVEAYGKKDGKWLCQKHRDVAKK